MIPIELESREPETREDIYFTWFSQFFKQLVQILNSLLFLLIYTSFYPAMGSKLQRAFPTTAGIAHLKYRNFKTKFEI